MAVLETVRKAIADGDVDFLREGVRVLAQAVMEAEVTELTGVPKGERDPERRLTSRNGYRDRCWDTRVGKLALSIPRVRDGTLLPKPARAAPAGRASAAGGRPGSLCARRQHPAERRDPRSDRAFLLFELVRLNPYLRSMSRAASHRPPQVTLQCPRDQELVTGVRPPAL